MFLYIGENPSSGFFDCKDRAKSLRSKIGRANANLAFDSRELAFIVVHQLVHRGHNRLAHHRAVEAEEDARVSL